MPKLFALTTTHYVQFDDLSNSWINIAASPSGSGSKLKYFGNGLLAHLANNLVYISHDSGATFTAVTPPVVGERAVAYDIDIGGRVWVGWADDTIGGSPVTIYNSFDGIAWTSTGHNCGVGILVFDITCHPSKQTQVAVARNESSILNYAVDITQDDGATWSHTNLNSGGLGFASSDLQIEWVDSGSDRLLILQLRTSGTLLSYTDDFFTTQNIMVTSVSTNTWANSMRIGANGAIFVGKAETSDPDLYRSLDRGLTWSPYTFGVALGNVVGGALTDTLYIASSSVVNQLTGVTTASSFAPADLVTLPSPGTLAGRGTLTLLEEGVYQPIDLPIDHPPSPPNSSTPGSSPGTPGAGGSWIYDLKNFGAGDPWADGAPMPLISLHDRVPPGKYSVVRGTSGQTSVTYATSAKSQGARGVIFVLGDSDDPPTTDFAGGPETPLQHRGQGLRWQPDPNGKAWQKFQDQLNSDQIQPDPSTGTVDIPIGKLAGSQALRDLDMVVGGMFICGQGVYDRPAHAAAVIASVRNRLNLDFILIDIDTKLPDGTTPVWNQSRATAKLSVLTHHIQQRCVRSPRAPNAIDLSSHCPVWIVFPASPFGPNNEQLYPNLLVSPDSPVNDASYPFVDGSNLVAPFQQNYTSPVTFSCPRVPALGNQSDLINAWQWAKPMRELNIFLGSTHSGMMFDTRDGGDPSGMVSQVATDDGLTVKFNNSPQNWTVMSSFIVYDGDGVVGGGTTPTKYWDFDGQTVHNQYVPALLPDPPPIGIVNQLYQSWIDSRGRTISDDQAKALNGFAPHTPTDTSNVPSFTPGPSTPQQLSITQAFQLAVQAGFTGDAAVTATAIMIAESGLVSNQIGQNLHPDGSVSSTDRGIAQINDVFHPEVSDTCAFDPVCATQQMFRISSSGTDFTPWATFNQGTYLSHVSDVQQAADTLTGSTGPVGPGPGPISPEQPIAGGARRVPLRLWFENWKVGNTVSENGDPADNFQPHRFDVGQPGCVDLRQSVPSWIELNGRWMIPAVGSDYLYEMDTTRVSFSGTPRDGDEGLFVLGIAASRGSSISPTTLLSLAIPVSNPKKMLDTTQTETGIPSSMPDAKALSHPDDNKHGSPFRAVVPLTNYAGITDVCDFSTVFGPDFCPGTVPIMPTIPLAPRGTGVVPTTATLCGAPYIPELVPAAQLNCKENGIGVGEFGVCWFGGNQPLYMAFVAAAAGAISKYDPHYTAKCGTGHPNADPLTGCCQFGLFGLDICTGTAVGHTRAELFDPAVNASIAFPDLRIAFQDANVSMSGASPCHNGIRPGFSSTEVVQHALIGFMERSGMFPGVHGSPGEVGLPLDQAWHIAHECQLTTGNAQADAMIATIATSANCYINSILSGGLPVGAGGSGGQAGSIGGGGSPAGGGSGTGGVGGNTSGFLSTCPIGGTLTADCDWHYANEGIPAIDISCSNGATLAAACSGTIVFRGIDPYARPRNGLTPPNINLGLGIEVRLACDEGNMTVRYGHTLPNDLHDNAVPAVGSHVDAGALVAHCDTSGYAFGSHVHLETWQGSVPSGKRICPQEVLGLNCP